MQKCEKCNLSFSWSKIFKSYKWDYGPFECDKCGTRHKITIWGRFAIVAVSGLPMQIFYAFSIPFDDIFVTLGIGVLIAVVGLLISPYVIRYKAEL